MEYFKNIIFYINSLVLLSKEKESPMSIKNLPFLQKVRKYQNENVVSLSSCFEVKIWSLANNEATFFIWQLKRSNNKRL